VSILVVPKIRWGTARRSNNHDPFGAVLVGRPESAGTFGNQQLRGKRIDSCRFEQSRGEMRTDRDVTITRMLPILSTVERPMSIAMFFARWLDMMNWASNRFSTTTLTEMGTL